MKRSPIACALSVVRRWRIRESPRTSTPPTARTRSHTLEPKYHSRRQPGTSSGAPRTGLSQLPLRTAELIAAESSAEVHSRSGGTTATPLKKLQRAPLRAPHQMHEGEERRRRRSRRDHSRRWARHLNLGSTDVGHRPHRPLRRPSRRASKHASDQHSNSNKHRGCKRNGTRCLLKPSHL
jgi:hypothetical protein